MIDKSLLSIKEFKGLHVSDTDTVFPKHTQGDIPFANALDCVNLEFQKKGGLRTRNGIDTYMDTWASTTIIGKPMQAFRINNLNGVPQTDRWLILTWDGTSGRVYDNQVAGPATNPVLTLTGMKYAYVLNVFGKIYLTPWKAWAEPNDVSGAHGWVNVYNGQYNFRQAGGLGLTTGTFAAAIGAGGFLTAGTHYIGVLSESDSGCISIMEAGLASAPLSVVAAAGNLTANLTNIPIGPTGTAKRHIVMTKAATIVNANGFFYNEPFFALTINDNTTTTGSITIPDSQLVETAKQYLSLLGGHGGDIIRACVSMSVYNNRVIWNGLRQSVLGSFISDQHAVLVSPPFIPEQVSHIDGSIAKLFCGLDFAGKVMNGAELNGRYFVFKEDSTLWFNEGEEELDTDPADWKVNVADPAKGAYPFGISGSGDNPGSASQGLLVVNNNFGGLIVAGNHGLSLFNGTFADIPLSEYNIEDITDIDDLKWSKVVLDGIRKYIFWHLGDPDVGYPNVRVGDFKFGLRLDKIRWGIWDFPTNGGVTPAWIALRPPKTPGTVGPTNDFDTLYPLLTILKRSTDCSVGFSMSSIIIGDFAIDDTFANEENPATEQFEVTVTAPNAGCTEGPFNFEWSFWSEHGGSEEEPLFTSTDEAFVIPIPGPGTPTCNGHIKLFLAAQSNPLNNNTKQQAAIVFNPGC